MSIGFWDFRMNISSSASASPASRSGFMASMARPDMPLHVHVEPGLHAAGAGQLDAHAAGTAPRTVGRRRREAVAGEFQVTDDLLRRLREAGL